MGLREMLKMKVISILSKDNTIIQTENFVLEDNGSEEEAIELIKEKWEGLNFRTSLEKINNIISKAKKKVKWNLLKANLYYEIDVEESKKILEYLEKNYFDEIKQEKEYFSLKYKIYLKEEDFEKLIYDFSEDKDELLLIKYLLEYQYDDALMLLEKLDRTNELNYLILSFNNNLRNINLEEEIISKVEEIITKIEEQSLINQLKNLLNLIEFLEINIPLLSENILFKLESKYLEIYKKNFKLSEYVASKWEKKYINTYLGIELKNNDIEIKRVDLLKKYKEYLDEYNNITYLIMENKGYKNCIVEFISNQNFSKVENIYNKLFFMKKYKYIIQNYRKYLKNNKDVPLSIKRIEIYSKFMCKKNLSLEEFKILNSDKDAKLSQLCATIYKYQNKEININVLREKIIEFLDCKLNIGYFHICIIRMMYLYDKRWLIEEIVRNKQKYLYLIKELIDLSTSDFELDGITYDKVCSLEKEIKNLDYESIGIGYIEYKNLKRGLYYLNKAWKKEKSIRLAKIILIPLLNLKKYDDEIYNFLKNNLLKDEIKYRLQNSLMLSFENFEKAEIEMNEILLVVSDEEIELNMEFFQSIYFKFLLLGKNKKDENLKYENALFVEANKRYLPKIYPLDIDKKYSYYEEEEFPILKLENKLVNLNTFLIMDIVKRGKLLEKKVSGIIKFKFDENNIEKFLKELAKVSGKNDFEEKSAKYFKNVLKTPLILPRTKVEFVNEFIEKLILNFDNSYLNKTNTQINSEPKILSLDSMIFLYKLNLLRYIEYNNIIVLKSSILTLEESMYYKSDYLEILKIIREYKVEIFNNIDINDLTREREIRNFEVGDVMKLFYACMTKKAAYITEDKNNLFKDKYPTYSALYLVIKQAISKKKFLEEINSFSPDAKRIVFNMLLQDSKLTV